MKLSSSLSVAGLLSVLLTFNGSAAPYNYQDIDSPVVTLNATTTFFSGTFDIVDVTGDVDGGNVFGYNQVSQTILSGTISFLIYNNNPNVKQRVSIQLEGEEFIPNSTLPFGFSLFGDDIAGQAYLTLDSTGLASYTVTRNGGEFTLLSAELFVVAGDRAQIPGVPDSGTTVALLGLSLVGLGMFSRTLKRNLV